jgi:hypothetical protein
MPSCAVLALLMNAILTPCTSPPDNGGPSGGSASVERLGMNRVHIRACNGPDCPRPAVSARIEKP